MIICAKLILPSLGYRFTCDVYAHSICINENGKERPVSTRELMQMANGHRVFVLGPVSA